MKLKTLQAITRLWKRSQESEHETSGMMFPPDKIKMSGMFSGKMGKNI
jgi:hypothetical protein